jgi:hypothetical protein
LGEVVQGQVTQAGVLGAANAVLGSGAASIRERIAAPMSSVMVKPIEYFSRRPGRLSQDRNSWVPPPESVRIST